MRTQKYKVTISIRTRSKNFSKYSLKVKRQDISNKLNLILSLYCRTEESE